MGLLATFMLAGCDGPLPMSEPEATVYNECLAAGHQPRFFANGSQRDVTCKPDKSMKPKNGESWKQ